jgi:hypothetical protein
MSPCLAYRDDGSLCRASASIFDHQRGGLVCLQHVPADVAAEIALYLKMGTVEGRLDNDGEVYSWRLGEAEAFDTYHCPTHGARRYSGGEVRQAERDETCLYVCTLCGQVADPTPFDAGAKEEWAARVLAVLQEVQSYIGAGLLTHPLPELVEDLRARIARLLQEAEGKGKESPRC